MKVKKVIKYIFIGIVVWVIGKIIFQEIFDYRPFKFEKYKTSEQLEEAVQIKFPVGSDMNKARGDLEKSGAKCREYRPPSVLRCYCEYNTYLFTLHPLKRYKVWLTGDHNRKLVEVSTAQLVEGLWMYIP